MDAAVARMPECVCGKRVDENDWRTPYCSIDGALVHAKCCEVCKAGFDHETTDLEDQLQKSVGLAQMQKAASPLVTD